MGCGSEGRDVVVFITISSSASTDYKLSVLRNNVEDDHLARLLVLRLVLRAFQERAIARLAQALRLPKMAGNDSHMRDVTVRAQILFCGSQPSCCSGETFFDCGRVPGRVANSVIL